MGTKTIRLAVKGEALHRGTARRFWACIMLGVFALGPVLAQAGPPATEAEVLSREVESIYSSRGMLAVGTLVAWDRTSNTVTVAIDRELSGMPNAIRIDMDKASAAAREAFLDREWPTTRTFALSHYTVLLDKRLAENQEESREELARKTARERHRIAPEDFAPGELVGVYYRMGVRDRLDALVLMVSKMDPPARRPSVDFNPFWRRQQQILREKERPSSPTQPAEPVDR